MALAPRPPSAERATVVAAGPKANSVTMRRSKASAFAASGGTALSGALGRGQTTAAAIRSAGNKNPNLRSAKAQRDEDSSRHKKKKHTEGRSKKISGCRT